MTTRLARLVDAGRFAEAKDLVEREAAAKRAARARKRSRPPRAPDTKSEKRATRREYLAAVRVKVMERAGDRCEACQRGGFVLELHHLLSGPLRRLRESEATCLGICMDCHRSLHRGDVAALRNVKEAAIRLGMREGLAAVERRLTKIEEVRR